MGIQTEGDIVPFKSRAQQRFAFGTNQPWAKEWASKTNFKKLPARVKKRKTKKRKRRR